MARPPHPLSAGLALLLLGAPLFPSLSRAQGAAPGAAPSASSAPSVAPAASSAPSAAPAASSAPAAAPAASGQPGDDLLVPAPAPEPSDNPYIPVFPERRSGFVLGMEGGIFLSNASGTRQKFSLRGQTTDTGVSFGNGGLFYFGGALTDWFVFRLGFGGGSATKGDLLTSGGAFYVGVNLWPLFSKGGIYRDLGLGLDFGTGAASVTSKNDERDIRAEGSGTSNIRASIFYEPRLFWRISGGPAVSYEYRSTDTYDEHLVMLGGKLTFYGGP